MPVAYFKCECGDEHREVVPISHWGSVKNPINGHWMFDPELKRSLGPEPEMVRNCATCGNPVTRSIDPQGVPTKFLFNYMADEFYS